MKRSEPPIFGRHVVLVHNTDSGRVTGAVTAWKRLTRPHAFPCALCARTKGLRGVNPGWQAYLDSLSEPVHTLNRDQFRAEHASSSWRNVDLPAILLQTGPTLEMLVTAADIRRSPTIKQLMDKLDQALAAHPRAHLT